MTADRFPRRTVYVAGPYGARERLTARADDLRRLGWDVSSSWLREPHTISAATTHSAPGLPGAVVDAHARIDLAEVVSCDVFVLFTAAAAGCEGGGGRHVEMGAALVAGVPVVVVGEPENIFQRMARVVIAPDWPSAAALLEEVARG